MEQLELIVAIFEGEETRAGEVLELIQKLASEKALVLKAAAVIVHTQEGQIEITEIGDVDSKQGRVLGAVSGALVGLLGGPIGAVAGAVAGAAAGGVAASLIDLGVPQQMIDDVKADLKPGSSAIITYVALDWVYKAIANLQNEGAIVHHETIQQKTLDDAVGALEGAPA